MDRQPPRRALGDATGRAAPERLSEYFDFVAFPEKADRKVTRAELLALLTHQWRVERQSRWTVRLWRFLRRRPGSAPAPIGEPS